MLDVETKTEAEINAEKATKPRVDLIPAPALAGIGHMTDGPFGLALARLAESARGTNRESRLASLVCAWLACCDGLELSAGGALILVGEVMGVGLVKHGPCTWRVAGTEQASAQTHYASAVRHLAEALDGRTEDRDSGRHPGVHALCQIAILYDLIADPPILPGVNDGRGAFVL